MVIFSFFFPFSYFLFFPFPPPLLVSLLSSRRTRETNYQFSEYNKCPIPPLSPPFLPPPTLSLFLIVSDNKKSKLVIIIMPLISRIESFGSLLRLWREICVVGGRGRGKKKKKREGGKKTEKEEEKTCALASKREREKVAGHRAKFLDSLCSTHLLSPFLSTGSLTEEKGWLRKS